MIATDGSTILMTNDFKGPTSWRTAESVGSLDPSHAAPIQ